MIGTGGSDEVNRFHTLMKAFENSPDGGTPLCRHIQEIISQIKPREQELRSKGQKACVVIMTDGQSSDGNIAKAMEPLKNLPVWVVVRLCTDDDKIGDYWSKIDKELELGE